MILVDANLLIYATMSGSQGHKAAKSWLDEKLNGRSQVGLSWPSLLAFLRIVSNPKIFEHPMPMKEALGQVAAWLSVPVVWVPVPTERHHELVASLLANETRSDLVMDAHQAALAIEHGLDLCSTDGDFERFSGLRWEKPLAP